MAARRAVSYRAVQRLSLGTVLGRPTLMSRQVGQTTSIKNNNRNLHVTARLCRPAATTTAATSSSDYPTTHDQIQQPVDTQNFIDNKFVSSKATQWIDLHDPATNNLVTRVPQSTDQELKAAVESAQRAFPEWKRTSLLHRQQIIDRKSVV